MNTIQDHLKQVSNQAGLDAINRGAKNSAHPNATFKTKYAGEIARVSTDAAICIITLSKVKEVGDAISAASETATVPLEVIAQFRDAMKKGTAALKAIIERGNDLVGKVAAERAESEAAPTDEGEQPAPPKAAGHPETPCAANGYSAEDSALIAAATGKKRAILDAASKSGDQDALRRAMGLHPLPSDDPYAHVLAVANASLIASK
jgi:hypothetical protein